MRLPLLALAFVAACTLPGSGTNPAALTTETIAVTTLDAPASASPADPAAAAEPAASAKAPDPPPSPEPEPAAEPPPPAPPASPEAAACARRGGTYLTLGQRGLSTCQMPTRDGLKACRRKTDCEGECLARSGTCAPVRPLFGCTEILDDLGRRMTQCID